MCHPVSRCLVRMAGWSAHWWSTSPSVKAQSGEQGECSKAGLYSHPRAVLQSQLTEVASLEPQPRCTPRTRESQRKVREQTC